MVRFHAPVPLYANSDVSGVRGVSTPLFAPRSLSAAGVVLREMQTRVPVYDHYWRVKTRLPARKGTACRVLVRSRRMNSVLVEFASDGYKVVTSRNYVRRYSDDPPLFGSVGT